MFFSAGSIARTEYDENDWFCSDFALQKWFKWFTTNGTEIKRIRLHSWKYAVLRWTAVSIFVHENGASELRMLEKWYFGKWEVFQIKSSLLTQSLSSNGFPGHRFAPHFQVKLTAEKRASNGDP
jgi:hypothetical protein